MAFCTPGVRSGEKLKIVKCLGHGIVICLVMRLLNIKKCLIETKLQTLFGRLGFNGAKSKYHG